MRARTLCRHIGSMIDLGTVQSSACSEIPRPRDSRSEASTRVSPGVDHVYRPRCTPFKMGALIIPNNKIVSERRHKKAVSINGRQTEAFIVQGDGCSKDHMPILDIALVMHPSNSSDVPVLGLVGE